MSESKFKVGDRVKVSLKPGDWCFEYSGRVGVIEDGPDSEGGYYVRTGATYTEGLRCVPEELALITKDAVNNPTHYTAHPSGIECIQITEHMGFNLGNAVKYVWRADLKNDAIEDLRKAAWYIDREIQKRVRS